MSLSSSKARFSFQVKVLLPVVTVMVLLMAVMMWLVNQRISRQLHEQAANELNTAEKIFNKGQENRAANLLTQYRHIANEPRFKAVTRETEFKTTSQLLNDIIHELIDNDGALIASFTFLADPDHRVASANRDPQLDSAEFQAQSSVAVREASKGQPQVDTICVGQRLFYATKPADSVQSPTD